MIRDWVLVEWAQLANRSQLWDVQLTFQCGGLVLCGTLIGGQEYFEGIGRLALAGLRDAARTQEVTDAFAQLYDSYAVKYAATESTGRDEREGPEHIHFKDVQVLFGRETAGRTSTLELPYWRTRIEAIDGFLLAGSLQQLPVSSAASVGDEEPMADRDD